MKENTQTRFEDLVTQLKDIHADHPESAETPTWYGEKLDEEIGEFRAEVSNDYPSAVEWEKAVSELDDIGITLIGAYLAHGIEADTALLRMGAKLLTVRDRFDSGYYDERPRLKPRGGDMTPGTPIAFAEDVDYMSDYE